MEEKRKLVRVGKYTVACPIPPHFLEELNLQPKDTVQIELKKNGINITRAVQ